MSENLLGGFPTLMLYCKCKASGCKIREQSQHQWPEDPHHMHSLGAMLPERGNGWRGGGLVSSRINPGSCHPQGQHSRPPLMPTLPHSLWTTYGHSCSIRPISLKGTSPQVWKRFYWEMETTQNHIIKGHQKGFLEPSESCPVLSLPLRKSDPGWARGTLKSISKAKTCSHFIRLSVESGFDRWLRKNGRGRKGTKMWLFGVRLLSKAGTLFNTRWEDKGRLVQLPPQVVLKLQGEERTQGTFSVCPGKERAIHRSCTQDLALRCGCRPSWASGRVSS